MRGTPARSQLPKWLRALDDSRGLTWRTYNLLHRFDPLWTARFLAALPRRANFERPVFILGASRSGTSMLFQALRETAGLGGMSREGHDLWRLFHHPRSKGWDSDYVGTGELRFGEKRVLEAALRAFGARNRFLDKTPENALRLKYLLELWPDARFLVIWRNPCDVVNSMINGWRDPRGRFRSYFVPEQLHIPGYNHDRQWCFVLFPGWRSFVEASIPEIAVAQWRTFVDHLARARQRLPADQWKEVHLEHIVADPQRMAKEISAFTETQSTGDEFARRLADLVRNPPNVLSEPRPGKWRQENFEVINRLLPKIAEYASNAGYRVDPVNGDVEVLQSLETTT